MSSQVIIVAPNYELRRSLEFALEVEGFVVHGFESVPPALASPQATESICIVIDEEALFYEPSVLATVRRLNKPVLFLVDRARPDPQPPNVRIVRKPVLGNALIKAVRATDMR